MGSGQSLVFSFRERSRCNPSLGSSPKPSLTAGNWSLTTSYGLNIPFSSGLGSDPGARQAQPVRAGKDNTDGAAVLLRGEHARMACGSNRVGGRKQEPTEATQGDALPPASAVGIFGFQAGEDVKQKSHISCALRNKPDIVRH